MLSDLDSDMNYRLADGSDAKLGQCLELNGTEIIFLADQSVELGRALEMKVSSGPRGPHLMTAFVEVSKVVSQSADQFKVLAAIRTIKGL